MKYQPSVDDLLTSFCSYSYCYLLINRLRIFIHIHIFMNIIEKMGAKDSSRIVFFSFIKQRVLLLTVIQIFYILYVSLYILRVFCVFLYVHIVHKCIKIRSLLINVDNTRKRMSSRQHGHVCESCRFRRIREIRT